MQKKRSPHVWIFIFLRKRGMKEETQSIMIKIESLPWCKVAWCYCRQRCKRWIVTGNRLERHLSLCSLIRLPVLATSVTCHPVTGTGSRAEQAVKLSEKSCWNCTKACFFIRGLIPFLFWSRSLSFLFLFLRPPTRVRAHTHAYENASISEELLSLYTAL